MRNRRVLTHVGVSSVAALLVAWAAIVWPSAAGSGADPCAALADLAERIILCSSHPCLGDSIKRVREEVGDAIVTDDLSYYSDLAVAYPSARGALQGVVEWDMGCELDTIRMTITGFDVAPPALAAMLESKLLGCRIEWDADDPEAVGDDEVPVLSTFCSIGSEDSSAVDLEVYFGPDLLIVEMSR